MVDASMEEERTTRMLLSVEGCTPPPAMAAVATMAAEAARMRALARAGRRVSWADDAMLVDEIRYVVGEQPGADKEAALASQAAAWRVAAEWKSMSDDDGEQRRDAVLLASDRWGLERLATMLAEEDFRREAAEAAEAAGAQARAAIDAAARAAPADPPALAPPPL
jgi:hypothetical protein